MKNLEEYLVGLNFMGRVLQSPPDVVFLKELAAMPACIVYWPGIAANMAAELLEAVDGHPQVLAAAIASDHLRLFSGPNPIAPPWESVWLERDGLLFGKRTEEVAGFYQDWGMEIVNGAHQPADHIGLEMSFLGYLADIASTRPEILSRSGQGAVDGFEFFLRQHVLAFAPPLLAKAAANAESSFYRTSCTNCALMLGELEKVL